ncbi:MAG: amino acid ABC transporter permease [Chloroflexi bacterium]|nr:amino acid ABC transporter permease [Chloroflexota bacterium]
MATDSEVMRPPITSLGVIGWLRQNLFSSWYNTLLTFFSAWLLYVILTNFLHWALTVARWDVVTANLRLFMVGQYPPDQVWRVQLLVTLIALLFGLSWGTWKGIIRSISISLATGFGLLGLLPFSLGVRLWLFASLAAVFIGFILGHVLSTRGDLLRRRMARGLLAVWFLLFPLTIVLLRGFQGTPWLPPIGTNLWGGLLLTFLLAVVGILASFPLGVLLALGRRSEMIVIRTFSILFIELVRGVPLVTILFMAQIMLPLFLPPGLRIDRVIRAMVGITLFSAAYMAENVRGGLQSVPEGQVEAARALGLSGPLILLFIVLPQALRAVIPAIVGQFISLFKDTTLVAIIGLMDLLNVGRAVLANPQFLGLHREVYLFIAVIFFIFSYAMSYSSYRLEEALGVGER